MSKKWVRTLAIIVALVFVAWVLSGILTPKPERPRGVKPRPVSEYEPPFTRHGDLWVVNPETQDTLTAFEIEIADTDEKIQYGMMYRKTVDPKTAMLFFMPEEQMQSFWMKNTLVPLDIIYINSKWEVVSIQKNAEPLTTTSRPSEGPAKYVLEIKGGLSDNLGIEPGQKVFIRRDAPGA